MAGLTNKRGALSSILSAPTSMVRDVAVGAGDTIAGVAAHFGMDPTDVAGRSGLRGVPLNAPLGEQGVISLSLLAQPIPPFVSMTSPVPAGTPYPFGTGWLGAVSEVQGQYAGQPLSTNM